MSDSKHVVGNAYRTPAPCNDCDQLREKLNNAESEIMELDEEIRCMSSDLRRAKSSRFAKNVFAVGALSFFIIAMIACSFALVAHARGAGEAFARHKIEEGARLNKQTSAQSTTCSVKCSNGTCTIVQGSSGQ